MRRLVLVLLAGLSACHKAPSAPPPKAAVADSAPGKPVGDVALFVRDATGRPLLADDVCKKLIAAGVPCRSMITASQKRAPWTVDADAARASGAVFTVRVTVIQRREDIEEINRNEGILVSGSGVTGRQILIDKGSPQKQDDLRLDVIASMRLTSDGSVLERWSENEGMLDSSLDATEIEGRWSSLYDAVADRLTQRIVSKLSAAPTK